MPNIIDLTGQRFERLLVLSFSGIRNKVTYWKCLCDCGIVKDVRAANLRNGTTKSCGCYNRDNIHIRSRTHGHTINKKETREYSSYMSMKRRCFNTKCQEYMDYGGRGITICERWLGEHGFEIFLSDMGTCPKGKTLDRYPNNETGNYEPSNCRWATRKQQTRNQRSNVWLEYDGRKQIYVDWLSEFKIQDYKYRRLIKKKTFEEIADIYIFKNDMSFLEAKINYKHHY